MLSSAGASWRTNLPINDTLSKRGKKDVFQIYHWGKAEARAVHGCGSSFVPLAGGGLLNCFDYPSGAVGKGIQAGDVNEVREKLKRSGPPGLWGEHVWGLKIAMTLTFGSRIARSIYLFSFFIAVLHFRDWFRFDSFSQSSPAK